MGESAPGMDSTPAPLSDARGLLAAIVESSDDAIVSKTLDGLITSWNRGAQRIFGYAPDEIIGRPVTTLIPPERVHEEADILQRLRRGERIEHYETVRMTKDGRLINVSLTVSPVRDASGRLIGASKVARDITAQKRASEALRRSEGALAASEARLLTILSLLPVGVYACDREGRVTFFNARAAELWGHEPSGLDVRFCGFCKVRIDGKEVEPERGPIARALREGAPLRDLEVVAERHDGTQIHASISLDVRLDEAGRPAGAIVVFQDISVQAAARQALRDQHRALEEAVAARTRELEESHQRLRLSERLASLGTLSVGIGHDMANLLVPVRVSLEALAASNLSAAGLAEVERIRVSAQYLQQLANGLRMMALDPERSTWVDALDLSQWWGDARAIVKNALPRCVTLEASVAEGCHVRISRPGLTQAVFNLAQNAGEALKGRADGKVRVEIKCQGGQVWVVIEDNGPGMTEDVRAHCMEPFFTTKTRAISTGLGLVLVSGLVREASGTVEIRSKLGKGTTFILRFPAASPARTEDDGRGTAVVDVRDARMRSVITAELRHLGLRVESTPTAAQTAVAVADADSEMAKRRDVARRVVLLAEKNGEASGVEAIGANPKIELVRQALRRAVFVDAEAGEVGR